MKYSDLISFNPIEDVIQLTMADDANRAKEYVKSYVMSDTMAANLKSPVLDQLQMDEVVDNKGVLVVGNYGTGKSHLMSVISSIAKDADNLQYLQNKNFAKEMECIAGKFEVLRIEIGGVTMSLREILFGFIEDDFAARGIDFEVPDFDTVRDNKKLIRDMMMAFSTKYPDKGYLIVVDEFLSYLTSRDERQIVLDLEFFRALGEMCSKSKLRVIFGVQEKIFDNPRFSFVSDTLKHVSDRFTQIVITKEATSYVVSERILKKTPEQKALIRKHLIAMQKACAAVKDEFSNYSARFNTPAKLNNFTLTFEEIDKLAEQIALIKAIAEYVTFKTDCANNVSYLSNIEFIDLGANFKQKLEAAKDEFRSARDSILTGTSGDVAAQKVNAALEKVKEEYIGIYFEEHKKKRLDIDDAKRRGKLQESSVLANLRKLRGVEILSAAKLTKIEQDMANLKVCYELTPTELKTTHICPHCHYNLGDQVPNVAGQLDNLDIRIDDLVTEWTQTLLNTISDPIVASQKEYLSAEQQKAIDDFIASGTLPKRVDDFFIKAIQALLKGFEPVVVDAKDLMDKLTKLPPMDEVSFKQKLNELIAGYTKGKDEGKLRIIVK